jgi:23S rRNA pseudouridine2604 synthase
MGELDLCSRREADRWIRQGRVRVDGQLAILGQQVANNLKSGSIDILMDENTTIDDNTSTAVVLHKPLGYVSGQAEHGHLPAIRLLTRDRLWDAAKNNDSMLPAPSSWEGFAPAGRLDLDSTGLLVFCSSGVLAKKLIRHDSSIEKKYVVEVKAAQQVTKQERDLQEDFELPSPTLNLTALRKGGQTLLGDRRPLLPCRQAKWLEPGKQLQLVLTEGRKHQIRRVCRQLLGYHVVSLQRIRIGPIQMEDLPEGCWRPLTRDELNEILMA